MRHLARLISLVLAALVLPVSATISALEHFIFPAYQPDADASLAFDRAAHALDPGETLRSRFRAFIDRCLDHHLFSAGRFHIDPGRAVA